MTRDESKPWTPEEAQADILQATLEGKQTEAILKGYLSRMTAERDALQAKYEAAVEVAAKYQAFYVVNKKGGYIPTLREIEAGRIEIKKEIAAKFANAADEGKRGKA